jgi:MFS family permease
MFFILRAQGQFSGKLSVWVPIPLYILFNIFYAAFAVPFGILSDRIGRKKVLILGYLLFSLTSFGFALFHSLLVFVVLFALYGMVQAIVDANQRAFVSDLSREELRASALGTFHAVIGLVALPSSLIAGLLWQNIAPWATFIYGSLVSVSAVTLFLIGFHKAGDYGQAKI